MKDRLGGVFSLSRATQNIHSMFFFLLGHFKKSMQFRNDSHPHSFLNCFVLSTLGSLAVTPSLFLLSKSKARSIDNMKPKNHPIGKENHLPNLHFLQPLMFQGVPQSTLDFLFERTGIGYLVPESNF